MKLKILLALAIAITPFGTTPVFATTIDDQDAAYQRCYDTYTARGASDGVAHDYCYKKAYGSETSGGGEDNYPTYPNLCNPAHGDCPTNPD